MPVSLYRADVKPSTAPGVTGQTDCGKIQSFAEKALPFSQILPMKVDGLWKLKKYSKWGKIYASL